MEGNNGWESGAFNEPEHPNPWGALGLGIVIVIICIIGYACSR